MGEEVQPIFDLRQKLRGLQDWAVQTSQGALASERAIAKSIKVNRSTFKSSIQKERMSLSVQEALAEAFGFHVLWPEWHDRDVTRTTPAGKRRDTAANFLDKFHSWNPGLLA